MDLLMRAIVTTSLVTVLPATMIMPVRIMIDLGFPLLISQSMRGNLNFGSVGRDVMDLVSGHEPFGGFNQAPSSVSESSSSNSSSADASKTE